MTGFATVYTHLLEMYPDNRQRGACLERIVADVLRADPMYRGRYSDVWLWNDWPDRKIGDIGVDVVARRTGNNGLTVVQVKCHDPGRTLRVEDVASFLAYTNADFTERIIVSTTSKWTPQLKALVANQRPPVRRLDLFGIEASAIDWGRCLERLRKEERATGKTTLPWRRQPTPSRPSSPAPRIAVSPAPQQRYADQRRAVPHDRDKPSATPARERHEQDSDPKSKDQPRSRDWGMIFATYILVVPVVWVLSGVEDFRGFAAVAIVTAVIFWLWLLSG